MSETTEAVTAPLGPVGDLVSETTTLLTEPLASPLEAVGDLGGTVTSTVDTVAGMTEGVGDVVASVPDEVLPGVLGGATDAILELPGGEVGGPAVELVDDTVEALGPVTDLVSDSTTLLTEPLASPLEAVGDLGGTVTSTVDTVGAVTESVGDVVASVPDEVLPGVLGGATDAILELPGGEVAGPAVALVDDTVETLGPVTDLVSDSTTLLTEPLASPLEAVGDLGGTVTSTVDTVGAVTENVGDVVASVPDEVLPAVLGGATDAILELPGGEVGRSGGRAGG